MMTHEKFRNLFLTLAAVTTLVSCGTSSSTSQETRHAEEYLSLLKFKMQKDTVGGIYYTVNFKNMSEENTIKYIYCSFFARNSVGDEVYCTIRGKGVRYVRVVGPLEPLATTGDKKTDAYIYNSEAKTGGFNALYLEYMDGNTITFSIPMINELMNAYNASLK